MRKATGFLLILFLATLVVISTSTGDQFDSSHDVHLNATYGPQITCDTSCHITSFNTGGQFLDNEVFATTTVCNPCHSPGGAYDGVDSTSGSVGAKDNWPPPLSVHQFTHF